MVFNLEVCEAGVKILLYFFRQVLQAPEQLGLRCEDMMKMCLLWVLPSFLAIEGAQRAQAQQTSENVWIWSTKCKRPDGLDLTVRLGHTVVYRAVLPMCHGSRDAEDGASQFKVSREVLRHHGYRLNTSEEIEADLWQAGGEPDALILGFSLATTKKISLNTLHVAEASRKKSTVVGNGFSITTYPTHMSPSSTGGQRR